MRPSHLPCNKSVLSGSGLCVILTAQLSLYFRLKQNRIPYLPKIVRVFMPQDGER